MIRYYALHSAVCSAADMSVPSKAAVNAQQRPVITYHFVNIIEACDSWKIYDLYHPFTWKEYGRPSQIDIPTKNWHFVLTRALRGTFFHIIRKIITAPNGEFVNTLTGKDLRITRPGKGGRFCPSLLSQQSASIRARVTKLGKRKVTPSELYGEQFW